MQTSAKVLIPNLREIPETDWLLMRKHFVGASEAAVVCGQSRWNTPLGLYMEKTEPQPQPVDSEHMWWGRQLEPLIRHRLPHTYQMVTGTEIVTHEWPVMLQSTKWPWMTCSPDGYVEIPEYGLCGLEIKTTTGYHKDEWTEGTLPTEYYYQVQHEMAVIPEWKQVLVAVLIDKEMTWLIVPRNESLIEEIAETEQEFMKRVADENPPQPVIGQDVKAVSSLYAEGDDSSVELPHLGADAEKLVRLRDDAKLISEEVDLLTARIKAQMKGAKKAKLGDRTATWSRFQRKWLDTKALRRDRPDIVREYERSAPTGRFTIK